MTTRDWQFLVWKSTATSLSTALVDFTVDNAHLASIPTITGSRLRILDGRTEARPWAVDILDSSSYFTSQIGDAQGRLDLMNRFIQARLSVDGSTYRPVAGGRLIDAVNADNIATWRVTVQDEWLAGSNALLFTTNTTFLYPPRPMRGYKDVGSGWAAVGTAVRVTQNPSSTLTAKRYWCITLNPGVPGTPPLTDEGVGFIRQDVAPTVTGLSTKPAFTHTRFRYNGTDYPVISFQSVVSAANGLPVGPGRPDAQNRLFDSDDLYAHQTQGQPLKFWVAASSTAFGGTGSKTFELSDNFIVNAGLGLHAMTAPASNATPLHLWNWSTANPYGTLHPMQVLKDVLDGVYSSSSESLPYYSTSAFTGTDDVRRLPTVGTAFRITQPARLKDWCEEHLLAPHGVAAFGDDQGRVTFKNVLLPDPQLGYSTANLFSFTSTNLTAPHPDWRASRREQVTQVELQYEQVKRTLGVGAAAQAHGTWQGGAPQGWRAGGDGLSVNTATTFVNHDRIARYGVWPVTYTFDGYGAVGDTPTPYGAFANWVGAFQYYRHEVAQRIFNRFGDGPIGGVLRALPTASTVSAGQFCRLTLGSYPNISNSQRGGTRLVQILSKDITPDGYQYEYLDAAAAAAIPTAPTLSLSTSTAFPKHALRVTVSAGIPTGGAVALYAAESATTSPPSSTSASWHPVYTTSHYGFVRTTGTYQLGQLKSGTRWFVKGQSNAPNSPRSNYSTPVSQVTGSLTSPSALAMSSVQAKTAGMTWTVGESGYPINVHVDTSTAGTPTTSNLLFRVPPGSNRTVVANLTPSQSYRTWVRHADPYGGFSGFDSTTFTMTSTASTANSRKAPPLGGMYVAFGGT